VPCRLSKVEFPVSKLERQEKNQDRVISLELGKAKGMMEEDLLVSS
jgi:hypothetical protein